MHALQPDGPMLISAYTQTPSTPLLYESSFHNYTYIAFESHPIDSRHARLDFTPNDLNLDTFATAEKRKEKRSTYLLYLQERLSVCDRDSYCVSKNGYGCCSCRSFGFAVYHLVAGLGVVHSLHRLVGVVNG
jgi:hypothetical protein